MLKKTFLFLIPLTISGCALLGLGKASAPVAVETTDLAVQALVDAEKTSQLICVANASTRDAADKCIADVAKQYAPIWAAYDQMRKDGAQIADFCTLVQLAAAQVGVTIPDPDKICSLAK